MGNGERTLFDPPPHGSTASAGTPRREPPSAPEGLDDATLVQLIIARRGHEVPALAEEAARRHLIAAIPALEEQCRAHIGWGHHRIISAQAAALRALAALGGPEARAAVERLIARGAVEGPGLAVALQAAAELQALVPSHLLRDSLKHDEPDMRAAACACRGLPRDAIPRLTELLGDLHPQVQLAAACALGRMGQSVACQRLLIALREAPSTAIVAALAPIADEAVMVHLGQVARQRPELLSCVLDVLDDLDHPHAKRIAAGLRRDDPS